MIGELNKLLLLEPIDRLKYLALMQVCPEKSRYINFLLDLQNICRDTAILSNAIHNVAVDGFTVSQTSLFVENVLCRGFGQYRLFLGNDTESHCQVVYLLELAMEEGLITYREAIPCLTFLSMSDAIASRLNLAYYELGKPDADKIYFPDYNLDALDKLRFSNDEIAKLTPYGVDDVSFINDYLYNQDDKTSSCSILKEENSYLILSPSSLIKFAWLEIVELLSSKISREDVCDLYVKKLHKVIRRQFNSEVCNRMDSLTLSGPNASSKVYQLSYEIYVVVTLVIDSRKEILWQEDTDSYNFNDCTAWMSFVDSEMCKYDSSAKWFHICIPCSLSHNFAVTSTYYQRPSIFIDLWSLQVYLDREELPMWLYYYAVDKDCSLISFFPMAKDADIIALYLTYSHSFYMTDKHVMDGARVCLEPGYCLSLQHEILAKKSRHIAALRNDLMVVFEHDSDNPQSVPIYEGQIERNLVMLGEYNCGKLFCIYPKALKESHPYIHAVARSILLWLYIIEERFNVSVINSNIRLALYPKSDGDIAPFKIYKGTASDILEVGTLDQSPLIEKEILLFLLEYWSKNDLISLDNYIDKIDAIFYECEGRVIQFVDSRNLIGDSSIGERAYYTINKRCKSSVLVDLQKLYNDKGIGPLMLEESKKLIRRIISYLEARILTILEKYDQYSLLEALLTLHDGLVFWHTTITERYYSFHKIYSYIGTADPYQLELRNDVIESDLVTRCLIEYKIFKCSSHGVKSQVEPSDMDELFALMSHLILMGQVSDYYQSNTFKEPIEILPSRAMAIPTSLESGINKYAQMYTNDRLRHPDVYGRIDATVPEIKIDVDAPPFIQAFTDEFGLSPNDSLLILNAVVDDIYQTHKTTRGELLSAFVNRISMKTGLDKSVVMMYVNSFSLNYNLRLSSIFTDYDLYPSRYKRKLSLITRPYCILNNHGQEYILFCFRGVLQSQLNLLENIHLANYAPITSTMEKFQGYINHCRGNNFENSLADLFRTIDGVKVYQTVKIEPGNRYCYNEIALGDIDILIVDNENQRILCVEAKNYLEVKTPYELILQEKKVAKDLKQVHKRSIWTLSHRERFGYYAKQPTDSYKIATICLTHNKVAISYLCNEYNPPVPIVWIRDIIENPKSVFEMVRFE